MTIYVVKMAALGGKAGQITLLRVETFYALDFPQS